MVASVRARLRDLSASSESMFLTHELRVIQTRSERSWKTPLIMDSLNNPLLGHPSIFVVSEQEVAAEMDAPLKFPTYTLLETATLQDEAHKPPKREPDDIHKGVEST